MYLWCLISYSTNLRHRIQVLSFLDISASIFLCGIYEDVSGLCVKSCAGSYCVAELGGSFPSPKQEETEFSGVTDLKLWLGHLLLSL